MGSVERSNLRGPCLGMQSMAKPPVPMAEDHPDPPPSFFGISLLKPPVPNFAEEARQKKLPSRPLIEDEDEFEAVIKFPDGDFARATSAGSSGKVTASTVDTVSSSWDSASWCRDLPPGTVIAPDRRLHEHHVRKMNRFLQDVKLAPKAFSGIIRSRRRDQ
ncbi:unnamed protein product [Symbiodinium natans]|uniref:Uncharacterized protein n=1 Tax=Symbiodinium natans TaxID=878477 RepID=A0A812RSC2_9DINO|nr:unnamed protein product [Symbiodinium natans]